MLTNDTDSLIFIVREITFVYKNKMKKTFYDSKVSVKSTYFEITKLNAPTRTQTIIYKDDVASFTFIDKY